jgi:(E)-4-hydroxy-3-methylbut-2-enyl-diphosphate synthase
MTHIVRRKTKQVKVGDVVIGGGAPIVVQSMTKTDTRDRRATLRQIRRLEKVGCEIVRLAIPDEEAAEAFAEIIRETSALKPKFEKSPTMQRIETFRFALG